MWLAKMRLSWIRQTLNPVTGVFRKWSKDRHSDIQAVGHMPTVIGVTYGCSGLLGATVCGEAGGLFPRGFMRRISLPARETPLLGFEAAREHCFKPLTLQILVKIALGRRYTPIESAVPGPGIVLCGQDRVSHCLWLWVTSMLGLISEPCQHRH